MMNALNSEGLMFALEIFFHIVPQDILKGVAFPGKLPVAELPKLATMVALVWLVGRRARSTSTRNVSPDSRCRPNVVVQEKSDLADLPRLGSQKP